MRADELQNRLANVFVRDPRLDHRGGHVLSHLGTDFRRRQDDDRRRARRAEGREQLQPLSVGQTQVEDDQIRRKTRRERACCNVDAGVMSATSCSRPASAGCATSRSRPGTPSRETSSKRR